MSTGVESFAELDTLGPIYPMVGAEVVLILIGIAIWIIWHIWQTAIERSEHKRDIELAKKWHSVRIKEASKDD